MEMSVTENKFIIMSRIAVLLNRKGFTASISMSTISSGPYCFLCVQDGKTSEILEHFYDSAATEADLLNWLGVLENE